MFSKIQGSVPTEKILSDYVFPANGLLISSEDSIPGMFFNRAVSTSAVNERCHQDCDVFSCKRFCRLENLNSRKSSCGSSTCEMDSGLHCNTSATFPNEALAIIHDQARICEERWQRTSIIPDHNSVRKRLELDFESCDDLPNSPSQSFAKNLSLCVHNDQSSCFSIPAQQSLTNILYTPQSTPSQTRTMTSRIVTPTIRKMQLDYLRSAPIIDDELRANSIGHNFNPYTPNGKHEMAALLQSNTCQCDDGHNNSSFNSPQCVSHQRGVNNRTVDERFLNQMRFSMEFDSVTSHLLAEGSFGAVIAAQNRLDGVWYVVKTSRCVANTYQLNGHSRFGMSSQYGHPSNAHQRYEAIREVWALAALREAHPHVLRYYSCWVQCDVLFILLEYANGGSLDRVLWRRDGEDEALLNDYSVTANASILPPRSLPFHRVLQLLAEIASALQFVHSHGIVHMDVKPANLLIHLPTVALPPTMSVFNRVNFLDHVLSSLDDDRILFKLGDLGHARDSTCLTQLEDGDGKYMPLDGLNLEQHPDPTKVDIYSLSLVMAEACGTLIPGSSADNSNVRCALRCGYLPSLPLLESLTPAFSSVALQLQHLLISMISPQPEVRPSALDLLETPLLVERLNWRMMRLIATAQSQENRGLRDRVSQLEKKLRVYSAASQII